MYIQRPGRNSLARLSAVARREIPRDKPVATVNLRELSPIHDLRSFERDLSATFQLLDEHIYLARS